jgi:hypothetical protein
MQISKKSSYLDKMHLEKVKGKNVIGPLKKAEPFLFVTKILFWVHFCIKRGFMAIFNENKFHGLLGLRLKFGVVFGTGFLANFHHILELSIKMKQELFH